jgi:P-type Cu+ transporter
MMTNTIDILITGMSCSSCVARVEAALKKVNGVQVAQVNLANNSAQVKMNEDSSTTDQELIDAIRLLGYQADIKISVFSKTNQETKPWRDFLPVFLALILSAPLLIPMLLIPFGIHVEITIFYQCILATVVQFIFGRGFYVGAYHAIRLRTGSMDLLVALGSGAGWLLSVGLWWQSYIQKSAPPHTYFETSSVIVSLVLLGKWLEKRAKYRATNAIRALCALQPETAHCVISGIETDVSLSTLKQGDCVVVRSGEIIPADGVVIEGGGDVDESMLTGEYLPVTKRLGDKLTTGTMNGMNRIVMNISAVGEETILAHIIRLVEEAQATKAPIQRLVDQVSRVFVGFVLLTALITLIGWLTFGGATFPQALIHMVAVLVVACPCAMGLATPAAIMVGTGVAAKAGILIKNVQVLENACTVNTIAFDKTGTLTTGTPTVTAFITNVNLVVDIDDERDFWLQIACALQSGSTHPMANALRSFRSKNYSTSEHQTVHESTTMNGCGIQGIVANRKIIIGKLDWLTQFGVVLHDWQTHIAQLQGQGRSISGLAEQTASGYEMRVLIGFRDQPKKEAQVVLSQLQKQGLQLAMLSGDSMAAAQAMARRLGLDGTHNRIEANLLPQDKLACIRAWQEKGERVAMVGDGMNDAPALAGATVGIAMGNGTDVAMHAADITLMRGNLHLIPAALDISKKTVAKIRSNLFWAFIYNVLGIPLAAFGYFNPVIAGAAMALSSLSVLGNALLLQRWKVPK